MRSLYSVTLVAVALALSGCIKDSENVSGKIGEPNTGVPQVPTADATFRAQFLINPAANQVLMPYPNDILGFVINGTTDGTLNLPDFPLQLATAAVNEIDGFSVYSRIQANFTREVDPDSLTPGTVFLIEVALDPATKGVVGLSDATLCKLGAAPPEACASIGVAWGGQSPFLTQGVDYEIGLAPDVDTGGQTIQLKPLRPLNSNRGNLFTPGTDNGYLLFLTDGITDTEGNPAEPDATYAAIRAGFLSGAIQLPDPEVGLPPGLTTEELLGIFIAAHLAVGEVVQIDPADVVVTASFTTQNTTAVVETVSELEILDDRPSQIVQALLPAELPLPGGGALPAGTPVTTGLLRSAAGLPPEANRDNGNIFVGGINIPYFQQTPDEVGANVLSSKWVAAAGGNLLGDEASTIISRWNPVPVKRADITIPVMIAVPNQNSAWVQFAQSQGFPVPLPTGWPVVIYQHGFTRNRTDMVLVAEPWLDQGYAVIAIDLPLHGVTATDPAVSPLALLRVPGTVERTFDLDLRNNANPASEVPDGIIDDSGTNFLQVFFDRLLTTRDNNREAVVGVLAVRRSLDVMELDGNLETTDLDVSQVHFVGHSGGAILGGVVAAACGDCASVSLVSGGAGLIELLDESDVQNGFGFFLAGLRQGLTAAGFNPFGSVYYNLLRDMQHVWNEGDPIGYLEAGRNGATPIFGSLVNTDVVVTPAASLRLLEGLGLEQVTTPGANFTSRGYTRITEGDHGSFISPAASIPATVELQTEVAVFLGGNPTLGLPPNGQVILIADPTVVETD
jgi:pimeloyl-ACP methyl ester carboxylesterase